MATFEDFWRLLYNHGSSPRYKNTADLLWDGLTPEQRQQLYDRIKSKIEQGKFVDYNPTYAIHDNMPRRQALSIGTPTDWNGKTAPAPTEIACYNGHWGMYTMEDIERFNLKRKEPSCK